MDVALTRRLLIENNKVKDIADVRPWEISAVRITIELNKFVAGNPWYGTIRQPNEERLDQHIATEKSFVSSLRQLLIGGKYKQPRKAAKKLASYWSAIRENVPEPFDDPKRYLLGIARDKVADAHLSAGYFCGEGFEERQGAGAGRG